jgi:hypothetical protein
VLTGVRTHLSYSRSVIEKVAPGVRGVEEKVVLSFGEDPERFLVDAFEYYEGRAEITISYLSIERSIPFTLMSTINSKVTDRMARILK